MSQKKIHSFFQRGHSRVKQQTEQQVVENEDLDSEHQKKKEQTKLTSIR